MFNLEDCIYKYNFVYKKDFAGYPPELTFDQVHALILASPSSKVLYVQEALDILKTKTYICAGWFFTAISKEALDELTKDVHNTSVIAKANIVSLAMILLCSEGSDVTMQNVHPAVDNIKSFAIIAKADREKKIKTKVLYKNFSMHDNANLPLIKPQ